MCFQVLRCCWCRRDEMPRMQTVEVRGEGHSWIICCGNIHNFFLKSRHILFRERSYIWLNMCMGSCIMILLPLEFNSHLLTNKETGEENGGKCQMLFPSTTSLSSSVISRYYDKILAVLCCNFSNKYGVTADDYDDADDVMKTQKYVTLPFSLIFPKWRMWYAQNIIFHSVLHHSRSEKLKNFHLWILFC